MDANMIGAYGPWAAGLSGEGPARLSFRQPRFQAAAIDEWRQEARERPVGDGNDLTGLITWP